MRLIHVHAFFIYYVFLRFLFKLNKTFYLFSRLTITLVFHGMCLHQLFFNSITEIPRTEENLFITLAVSIK